MRLLSILLFSATLLATSCRVAAPADPTVSSPLPTSFTPSAAATDTLHAGAQPWRQFFQDPALTALIDTALRQNLDLQLALQRVEGARAQYLARRGALLPTVSVAASAGADRFGRYTLNGVGNFDTNLSPNIDGQQRIPGPVTPDFFVGLRSAWEIDLWGKLRQRRQAAYLRVLASEQGRHLVTTNVVAEVARLYYELLTADNQLAVLERNLALQQEALGLMRVQKRAGRTTELAVQQFAAQVARTESLAHEARQRVTGSRKRPESAVGSLPAAHHPGPAAAWPGAA
jgi:outer membrane protein TolC